MPLWKETSPGLAKMVTSDQNLSVHLSFLLSFYNLPLQMIIPLYVPTVSCQHYLCSSTRYAWKSNTFLWLSLYSVVVYKAYHQMSRLGRKNSVSGINCVLYSILQISQITCKFVSMPIELLNLSADVSIIFTSRIGSCLTPSSKCTTLGAFPSISRIRLHSKNTSVISTLSAFCYLRLRSFTAS